MNVVEINYSTVVKKDISLAMKASSLATTAERKSAKNSAVVWEQTVCQVMDNINLAEVSRDTEKGPKLNGKLIKDALASHILANAVIPETGKNRQGQSFTICNKQGVPQWSTWDETRRIWDYAGTIGKILAFGLEEKLYPEDGKVAARCDIMALCKAPEGHMEAIRRQTAGLQLSLDKVQNASEAHEAMTEISALVVNQLELEAEVRNLIALISAKLSVADVAQKTTVKADLIAMASKHFQGI